MITRSISAAALLLAALVWFTGCSQPPREQQAAAQPQVSPVERGKYLVTQVGMCQDCHSSRTQTGEYNMDKWLDGAILPFQPTAPIPGFSQFAPKIAGLPGGWREADMITFLETGKRMDGTTANPPMPEYRLSKEDAEAMTAYLVSLRKPAAP